MPYVKISDPNIIDLAAWHQLINVVNQHSDSINSITNNFGVQGSGSIDWNADVDGVHEYTQGSEKILYGRVKVEFSGTSKASSTASDEIFYGDIDFGDNVSGATVFSAKPIVTATIQFGNTTIFSTNHNILLNVWNITKDQFSYRLTRGTDGPTEPLTGRCYINWQAIGPK
jgi:hypothetical protein